MTSYMECAKFLDQNGKRLNIGITPDLKNYDVESFGMDMINANWEDAIDNEDINLAAYLWGKEFLAILYNHAQNYNVKLGSFALSPY